MTTISRQIWTNVIQIIVPTFGLIVVQLIRGVILANSNTIGNKIIQVPVPFLMNIPLKPLSVFGQHFNVTDCQEWYMYEFAQETQQADREFFAGSDGMIS